MITAKIMNRKYKNPCHSTHWLYNADDGLQADYFFVGIFIV